MWRVVTVLILVLTSSVSFCQEDSTSGISISFNDDPLMKALRKIGNKTDYRLAFNTADVKSYRVSGSFEEIDISDLIQSILPVDLDYTLVEDLIVIFKAEKLEPVRSKPSKFEYTLKGRVLDFFTNEPLPYATIEVTSNNKISQSNQEGEFQFLKFPSDTSSIVVSYVGYRNRKIFIRNYENDSFVEVRLKPEATMINGVLIETYETTPLISKKEASEYSVNVLRIPQITNLGETDALALVKALPGFDSSTENNDGLGTRGLKPSENLYYLDGVAIFNPDHFFGLFSSLNSLSVKNIRILKGAYNSSYGGRSGTVFDITSFDGNDEKVRAKLKTGLLSSSLRIDGPMVSEKLNFSVTGRKSHVGLFKTGIYEDLFNSIYNSTISFAGSNEDLDAFSSSVQPEIEFMDLQSKLTYQFKEEISLAISGFYSDDFSSQLIVDSLPEQDVSVSYANEYVWSNYGGSLQFKHPVSKKSNFKHQLSYSEFATASNSLETFSDASGLGNLELQTSFDNQVSDITFKSKWNHAYSDSLGLSAGIEINSFESRVVEKSFGGIVKESSVNMSLLNYFGQFDFNRTKWRSQLGMRFVMDDSFSDFYWEPRVKYSYDLSSDLVAKMGYGRHHQFLRKTQDLNLFRGSVDEWRVAGTNETPISQVDHIVIGANYTYRKLIVDSEIFYVHQKGANENLTTVLSLGNQNNEEIVFGDMTTFGSEITAQLNLKRNNFSLSYAYYDSDGAYDDEGLTLNIKNGRVSRHNFSGLWLWENDKFRVSVNSVVTSGKPYTPVVGNYSIELANGTYRPFIVFGEYNSQELPLYNRTDLSLGYRTKILHSMGLELSGSVQNVFNNQNLKFYSYSTKDTSVTENFLILEREIKHLKRLFSFFITLEF